MLKKSSKLFGLLENEKIEIDALVQYVSNEKFNRKLEKDKWSIAQVIQHIYLAESQTLDAINWRIKNKTEFPNVSILAYVRVFYTVLLFEMRIKMKAPDFVTPSNDYIDKSELLENWQNIRNKWSDLVYRFPKKLAGKIVYKHPILGYLSLNLMLIFMYHHLRRHKLQLVELMALNETSVVL